MKFQKSLIATGAAAAFSLSANVAFADSIDPLSYSDTLAVGESVTIRKTVTVDERAPSSALIDVHFLIDTSGSMGSAIANAKSAAADIQTALAGFGGGTVATGVGVFSESSTGATNPVPGNWINQDLTTNDAQAQAAINAVTLGVPDGGGDFPERGQDAVAYAASNLSWRPGSNRFIVALGDASWKNDLVSDAAASTALAANGVDLIGLRFSNFGGSASFTDDLNFTESVEDLGGTVFSGGTSPSDIVDAITAGISASFAEYSTVTVDDLGNGLPEIAVSTACVSADIGTCSGADAVGDFDRSVARDFEFDVTFTRLAPGDTTFDTYALVDGGIVATEVDTFRTSTSDVPEPAALLLLPTALGGLAAARRRRRA